MHRYFENGGRLFVVTGTDAQGNTVATCEPERVKQAKAEDAKEKKSR